MHTMARSFFYFCQQVLFGVCLIVYLPIVLAVSLFESADAQNISAAAVPAVFIRELKPPGTANGFLRPDAVFVDNRFGEVYVSDPGQNRIVVFDTSGLFKFDFNFDGIFGSAGDLVVDSKGFVYVIGSTSSGKNIYVFDYDGLYLSKLQLSGLPPTQTLELSHLTIDESDNLYIVDGTNAIVCSFDTEGNFRHQFPVLTELTEKLRKEAILGTPQIADSTLYLPASTEGMVLVYDLSGNLLREIGTQGTDVGYLNFPVGVAVTGGGVLLVLDKHRFNVVCYSIDGKFLGEFGGMGFRPGWFYHPGAIAVDNQGRSYISQVYLNLVQVCALPESIIENAKSRSIKSSETKINLPLLKAANREEVIGQLTALLTNVNPFTL